MKIGEAGGEVILVSRTREKLEEVAKQVEDAGGTAHVHPADLSDLDGGRPGGGRGARDRTAASTCW